MKPSRKVRRWPFAQLRRRGRSSGCASTLNIPRIMLVPTQNKDKLDIATYTPPGSTRLSLIWFLGGEVGKAEADRYVLSSAHLKLFFSLWEYLSEAPLFKNRLDERFTFSPQLPTVCLNTIFTFSYPSCQSSFSMTDTTNHEVQASTSSSAMSGKSRPHLIPSRTTSDAEKTGARGKRGACDAWTEQVREPHLNNTHTHTLKTLTHFHPLYVRGASSSGFSRY